MNLIPEWPFRIAVTDPGASIRLAVQLRNYLKRLPPDKRIVIVCIGTDRSTGDSLGPLVGTSLRKFRSSTFDVFGTLEEPVHAMNLDDTMEGIRLTIGNPFIIGVDACLGSAASVGSIAVGEGPLRPGSGVGKKLTPVGDIHLTGIVNLGGFMELMLLQSTRLYLVSRMADLIARSLHLALTILPRENELPPLISRRTDSGAPLESHLY
ncbi:spore protease YyaC [Cohnella yongneupensis]|uniref:Spore protease YyaC n=1 Tax=Cohnella yongneupensis TaxID=425006 RepID=A0ABW0R5X8_9BACL